MRKSELSNYFIIIRIICSRELYIQMYVLYVLFLYILYPFNLYISMYEFIHILQNDAFTSSM